jgi:digeranylgeranylglycerophospholipid reductase
MDNMSNAAPRERCDVLVAGAGPAGLAVAQRCARAGLATIVADKASAIGVPIRTSGGSFIGEMQRLGVPAHLYRPIRRIRLTGPVGEVMYDYEPPAMCVLDVRGLYQWLGERAASAGAKLRLEARAELIEAGGDVARARLHPLRAQPYEVEARIVVDATGYASALAKQHGLHDGFAGFGVGAEWDLYAPDHDRSEALLLLGAELAPHGYGWAFPYGDGRVRLGVGIGRPHSDVDPHEYLDRVKAHVPSLRSAEPIEAHHGLIPFGPPRCVPLVRDRLVVVGDAAAQASALVGEGIRFAIDSGRMAGDAISKALANGTFASAALAAYEKQWDGRYGRKHAIAYRIYERVAAFTDADWRREIPALRRLTPAQFAQGLASDFTLPWALGVVARSYRGFFSVLPWLQE